MRCLAQNRPTTIVVSIYTKNIAKHFALTLLIAISWGIPYPGHAGVISSFTGKVKAIFLPDQTPDTEAVSTSQTMQVLRPVVIDDAEVTGALTQDATAASQDALSATTGSLRVSTEDIDYPTSDIISVYEVKKGDSLASIAKLFGVSKNTIMWANDLKSEKIAPGDTLVILPMTGIKHTVKNGDTIGTIAKKYKADVSDIAKFNGLSPDEDLSVGTTVLVPEGELAVTTTVKAKSGKVIVKEKLLDSYSNTTPDGFLIRPVVNARRTQGLHGHNGIDFGATPGTPVLASASGRVILAKAGGYNGGYGSLVIIAHEGGVQTVYAHLRQVNVSAGQNVSQGQVIGQVGNTGRSTGPHLHFEVRGAVNPF